VVLGTKRDQIVLLLFFATSFFHLSSELLFHQSKRTDRATAVAGIIPLKFLAGLSALPACTLNTSLSRVWFKCFLQKKKLNFYWLVSQNQPTGQQMSFSKVLNGWANDFIFIDSCSFLPISTITLLFAEHSVASFAPDGRHLSFEAVILNLFWPIDQFLNIYKSIRRTTLLCWYLTLFIVQ